jgi:hypothetical protein
MRGAQAAASGIEASRNANRGRDRPPAYFSPLDAEFTVEYGGDLDRGAGRLTLRDEKRWTRAGAAVV